MAGGLERWTIYIYKHISVCVGFGQKLAVFQRCLKDHLNYVYNWLTNLVGPPIQNWVVAPLTDQKQLDRGCWVPSTILNVALGLRDNTGYG